MAINMLHQLIINSIDELNNLFELHSKYLPSQELLESTELDTYLEGERDPDDPAVDVIHSGTFYLETD